MSGTAPGARRPLAAENAELRQQLASAQDLLVETAIDAGHLHARIEALQLELAAVRAERDLLLRERKYAIGLEARRA